jgi:hypothetical protein
MKTSLTKLKTKLVLLAIFAALPIWAKPVAQVTEISGQVFVVTPEGKTTSLKLNDHLSDKSEVMVEEGATITLNDYYDATYHLVGGSHLKFFDKSVQLKRGKTWVQSKTARHPLAMTTANGHADFWKSEFIATFDQATSRSQFLVVSGEVEVSNVLERNLKHSVSAGTFSLLDPEIENGIPRTPTRVGLNSLQSALAEFKKLPAHMKEESAPSRTIASVEEVSPSLPKRGEIIFISTNRMPASVGGEAHRYYKKSAAKKTQLLVSAPIRFFGLELKSSELRSPASVPKPSISTQKSASLPVQDTEFTESLKKQAEGQPKYSKELEGLINDLKSF